jgi:UDP-glucose 4-epimerase
MSILITGAAGFVGVNLARAMLERGETVVGMDNFCRGTPQNLAPLLDHPCFHFHEVDLHDIETYRDTLVGAHDKHPVTEIWHLAANSDIPAGVEDPTVDLRDTFITTFTTLVLMRELGIGTLAFASSSAIYGELGDRPLTEDVGPLFPISNYGAMKLASEAAISAAVESHLERAMLFRFPNVVGVPATHGVILDLTRKLAATPQALEVLGNGTQQKSYLHVEELIDAMLFIRDHDAGRLACYNIGATDAGVTVRFIAETVRDRVSPRATINFGKGDRGWVGDVPKFKYSVAKLEGLGWRPRLGSEKAIRRAVEEIAGQEGIH